MKKSLSIFLIAIIIFNALLPNKAYAIDFENLGIETSITIAEETKSGGAVDALDKLKEEAEGAQAGTGANTGNTDKNKDDKIEETTNNDNDKKTDTQSSSSKVELQNFEDVDKAGYQNLNSLITDDKTTALVDGKQQAIVETPGMFTTIIKGLFKMLSIIPLGLNMLISLVTDPYTEGSSNTSDNFKWYSIQDTVYGKISLFDINIFNTNSGTNSANNPNDKIKEKIASWYYSLRTIAIVASLLLLVYVGIKMTISTVASDQAKYKSMLISWATSMVILFILPYVFGIVFSFNDALIQLVPQKASTVNIEENVRNNVLKEVSTKDGLISIVVNFLILCMLTYYQLEFFAKYLKRVFKVFFLVIISPLITITYSLDKGSAHKRWFEEFIGAVFMQAVHVVIYSIFMFSASEIITKAPVIAIGFLLALSKGEKIFNYLFSLKTE